MSFNKEHAIIAQNSATAAATIVSSLVGPGDDVTEALDTFNKVREAIFNGTLGLAGAEAVVTTIESAPSAQASQASRPGDSAPSGGNRQDPGSVEVRSGKHRGKTIAAIYDEAPDYVEWLAESSNNTFLRRVASEYLASVA